MRKTNQKASIIPIQRFGSNSWLHQGKKDSPDIKKHFIQMASYFFFQLACFFPCRQSAMFFPPARNTSATKTTLLKLVRIIRVAENNSSSTSLPFYSSCRPGSFSNFLSGREPSSFFWFQVLWVGYDHCRTGGGRYTTPKAKQGWANHQQKAAKKPVSAEKTSHLTCFSNRK